MRRLSTESFPRKSAYTLPNDLTNGHLHGKGRLLIAHRLELVVKHLLPPLLLVPLLCRRPLTRRSV